MARWWVLVQGWSCRHSSSSQFPEGLLSETFVLGLHAWLINPTLSKLGKPLMGITFAPCIIFTPEATKTHLWLILLCRMSSWPPSKPWSPRSRRWRLSWMKDGTANLKWRTILGGTSRDLITMIFEYRVCALTQRCFRYVSPTNPNEIKDQNRGS